MKADRGQKTASRGQGERIWVQALAASAMFCALLGSTTPSPLYPTYATQFGLQKASVALIYAAYSVGTLVALGLLIRLEAWFRSRHRMIVLGLIVAAVGAMAFGFAEGLVSLLVGRFLSGLATGLITGSASAVIAEAEPETARSRAAIIATIAFTAGAAIGPILASAALHADLWPRRLPFAVIAVLSLLTLVLMQVRAWTAPDVRRQEERLEFEPSALAHASDRHRTYHSPLFWLSALGVGASWTVGAAIMSLGPNIAVQLLGFQSPATAGLLVSLFQLGAGIGQYGFGRLSERAALLIGFVGLAIAQTLLALAIWSASSPLFLIVAVATCGLGYGAAFVGAAGLINDAFPPQARLAAFSGFYVVGYICNGSAALVLGIASDRVGLRAAFEDHSLVVIILLAFGSFFAWRVWRASARTARLSGVPR